MSQVKLTRANLLWHDNLTALNSIAGKLGVVGMWQFVGECGDDVKVMQEPYCGADKSRPKGTAGLAGNWSQHVKNLAQMMVGMDHVVGMWMVSTATFSTIFRCCTPSPSSDVHLHLFGTVSSDFEEVYQDFSCEYLAASA